MGVGRTHVADHAVIALASHLQSAESDTCVAVSLNVLRARVGEWRKPSITIQLMSSFISI